MLHIHTELSITLALSAPLPLLLLFLVSIFLFSNSHLLTSRTLPLLLLLGINEGTSLISSITTTTLLKSKFQTLKPLFDNSQKISLKICSYLIFARTSLKICVDLRDFLSYMRAFTCIGEMCTTHAA